MSNIAELEQQIMEFSFITKDIEVVTKHLIDHSDGYTDDDVMNKYMAIKELYDVKFEAMWRTFENIVSEYHRRGFKGNA